MAGVPQVRRWRKATPLIGFRPRACLSCPRSQVECGCKNPKTRACHPFAGDGLPGQNANIRRGSVVSGRSTSPARGHEGAAREGQGGKREGVCQDAAMFSAPGLDETADVMSASRY